MKKLNLLFAILILVSAMGYSQPKVKKLSDKDRMEWWHEAKFGMFIHWGVYAQFAGVYNGHEQARGGAEWIMNRCKIPVAEYQAKAKEFNPVNYNPDAWVKMAKDAGMKYNPGGSAARKVMKEGWENPDSAKIDQYTKDHSGHWDPAQTTATFDEYIDRVAVPQVREILSNYGEISVLWWDTPTNMTDEAALKLQKMLELQPNIITNDRLKRPNFPGDTKTPEQKIPDQDDLSGQNWETCMTMNGSWGWRDDNKWKPIETLIRNLVDIASKGGNYLLNVGPKPDGTFPDESIERLKKVGQWMDVNSEAIYGTQASPLGMLPWGRCTYKEVKGKTNLYLSVFDWPKDGILTVPGLKNKVVSAKLMATGASLKTSSVSNNVNISLPATAPDAIASVIKLEVKGQVVGKTVSGPKKEMKSGALD